MALVGVYVSLFSLALVFLGDGPKTGLIYGSLTTKLRYHATNLRYYHYLLHQPVFDVLSASKDITLENII